MKVRKAMGVGLVAVACGWSVGSIGWRVFGADVGTTQPGAAATTLGTQRAGTRADSSFVGLTTQQRIERMAARNQQRQQMYAAQMAEARKRYLVKAFSGHTDGIYAVAFSPDGKLIASGSGDSTIKLWDVASGKLLNTLQGHAGLVTAVAFSPDGKRVVSGGFDRQLIAWNVATGEIEAIFKQPCYPYHVAFLPDSSYFVSTCGEHLRLWKVGEAGQVLAITADSTIECMAVTKDGAAVTGDEEGTVALWDTSTGEALLKKSRPKADSGGTNGIESVGMLKNGDALVGDSEYLWRWNLTTGEMKQINPHTAPWMTPIDDDREAVGFIGPRLVLTGLVERLNREQVLIPPLPSTGGSPPRAPWFPVGDRVNCFAVSPSGELGAVARGGSFNSQSEWVSCGPRDVEIFNVAAILKEERERMSKDPHEEDRLRKRQEEMDKEAATRPRMIAADVLGTRPAVRGWQ